MATETRTQCGTPSASEWEVRGHLAASLTFWHRLKDGEDDELVALFQRWATHAATTGNVLEDAARWQEHVGKLDALVAYCPTCCQGFVAQKEMTRDQIIFECGKTAGRAARKQGGA